MSDLAHVHEALYDAFGAVAAAIVGAASVYEMPGNATPPNDDRSISLFMDGMKGSEPDDRRVGGNLLNRQTSFLAVFRAKVPKVVSARDFERTLIAPFEVGIANSPDLARISSRWWLSEVGYNPAKDGDSQTVTAAYTWTIDITTPKNAPGQAL